MFASKHEVITIHREITGL